MEPQPLSTKLQADYIELADLYLARIPVTSGEDVRTAVAALRALSSPSDRVPPSSSLEGRAKQITEEVQSVKEMLDSPETWAKPEHRKEFERIIRDRIARKISELESLSPEGMRENAERLERKQAKTAVDKEKISGREPPPIGSEAHVVSEEEALRLHFGYRPDDVFQETMTIAYASETMRNDPGVVLAAIRYNGRTLR